MLGPVGFLYLPQERVEPVPHSPSGSPNERFAQSQGSARALHRGGRPASLGPLPQNGAPASLSHRGPHLILINFFLRKNWCLWCVTKNPGWSTAPQGKTISRACG